MSTLTSTIDEKVSQATAQAGGLTQEAAGNLHAAASSVRKAAQLAADKLDEAGSYVGKYDVGKAVGESKRIIRQYPAELVAVAAGVGFLSGLAFLGLIRGSAPSNNKARN
jgi:ElaB/YqjD/DUF883 family membrane-anchored ribosome-binding protein